MEGEQLPLLEWVPDWLESPMYPRAMVLLDLRCQEEERQQFEFAYSDVIGKVTEQSIFLGLDVWKSKF